MDKYDRQVRLWNVNGQTALASSKVCLINADTTGSEVLQNLVLPGVGEITIVDDGKLVTSSDLGSNFFLREGDEGKVRSDAIASVLSELNPDVVVKTEQRPLKELLQDDESGRQFLGSFGCVIVSSFLPVAIEQALSELLWSCNVCVAWVNTIGFYGMLRLSYKEQTIVETHDNDLTDLRIDAPWPELLEHVDKIDLNTLDDQTFANVPYGIILTKALQAIASVDGTVTPRSVRQYIDSISRGGEESNLDEAKTRAVLSMKKSTDIPPALRQILDEAPAALEADPHNLFWALANALKGFYDEHGVLPLSGVLPDMESDTEQYMGLVKLYRDKFTQDKNEIRQRVEQIDPELAQRLDDHTFATFTKNCRHMQVHRGSNALLNEKLLEQEVAGLNIYLGFLAVRQFYDSHEEQLPTPKDRSELRQDAISMLCRFQDVTKFPEGLEKVLDELCRAQGTELHNVASLVGGLTAQECLKVLANQYVTLDNTLTYDGIGGGAATFKL